MAEYLIQDTTLTAIGDAIRAKEDSSDPIQVSEIAARIAAIETGVTVQRASGTFTTNSSGTASVDCGFKPDVVLFIGRHPYNNGLYHAGVDFYNSELTNMYTLVTPLNLSFIFTDIFVTQTSNGFSVSAKKFDNSFRESIESNRSIDYIAIKYT